MKYRSIITWPDGVPVKTESRLHDSEELADSYVARVKLEGYDGYAIVFPESVRVKPETVETCETCTNCGCRL